MLWEDSCCKHFLACEGQDASCLPMAGVPDSSSGMLIFPFLLCLEEQRKMYRGLSVRYFARSFFFRLILQLPLEGDLKLGPWEGVIWDPNGKVSHRGGLGEK